MTARLLRLENARPKDLIRHKIICIGSPTYYDLPALEVELFLKKCEPLFPKLRNKSWYLFATSKHPGSAKKAIDYLKELLSHKKIEKCYNMCLPS